MLYGKIESKWGGIICGIEVDGGIAGLWFEKQKYFPEIPNDAVFINDIDPDQEEYCLAYVSFFKLKNQLEAYEAGSLKQFELPVQLSGTKFRKLVWDLLLKIPYGETWTYGELAKEAAILLGKSSMSAQAIGGAVGHNPISVIIPCHRVVGSDGGLVGYAGGLEKKEALLAHERTHC